MNARASKPMQLRRLLVGIAGILVSGIAIASLAISVRGSNAASSAADLPEAVAERPVSAPRTGAYKCKECGVIESARKIGVPYDLIQAHAPGRFGYGMRGEAGESAGRYAITIRLKDGSTRVVTDAHPANWRPGERVSLIAGMQ